jgi:pimeloyl-ACP methyl ester carboxylesterase
MTLLKYQRRGQGHPLVFVHGYLAGSEIWAAQIDRFSSQRDVICPDLAGFGKSGALEAPNSITGHAKLVLDFLDHLGVTSFDLVGHSMGGMVVQEMARLAPTRINTLVLYGTGPVGVLPGRFETTEQSRVRLQSEGLTPTARRIAATWFLNGEEADGFDLCLKLGQQASLQAALASLEAWENWDGRPNLAKITARSLVIWGSHDRSYEWSQPLALWQGIQGCDIAVVPMAAHNVHLEKPKFFNDLLEYFIAERQRK